MQQQQQVQPKDDDIGGLMTTLAPYSDTTHAAGVAPLMSFAV
jgi:hypothetical protein